MKGAAIDTHALADWPAAPDGEAELFARLRRVCEEGLALADRIERPSSDHWHSFVPADYDTVLRALMAIREPRGAFLELGSAIGVITIMADLLGFEAYGIEIDPNLVSQARRLASAHGSNARFATGSFLPEGYRWVSRSGDTRMGTMGIGEPAYPELKRNLDWFEWVYAFPWPGEAEMLRDMMRQFGGARSHLLLHGYGGGLRLYPTSR